MRNGGIAQDDGNLSNAESFFIQQIPGMLHPLALVEIEYSRTKHFLESLLKVALIDSRFPAEFLNRKRLPDVLEQYFPCPGNLLTVCFVGKELAAKTFDFPFPNHA